MFGNYNPSTIPSNPYYSFNGKDTPTELVAAMPRRILLAQALYFVGAALCFINTYWSIAFIILVQLNYVFAPRFGWLYRI